MGKITFKKNGKEVTFNASNAKSFTIGGEYGISAHDKDGNVVPMNVDTLCPCCKPGGTDDSRDCTGSLGNLLPIYKGKLEPALIPLKEEDTKTIRFRRMEFPKCNHSKDEE